MILIFCCEFERHNSFFFCFLFKKVTLNIQSMESILKCIIQQGPLCPWSYGSWIYNYLCNQCLSPLKLWVWSLCNIVCQWFCWWFSSGPLVSSTNKTDRHDIAEILLKVALNTINQTKPNQAIIQQKWKTRSINF